MANIIRCQTFGRAGFTELGVGLIQIFPDSPLIKEAEAIYVEVRAMLEDVGARS